MSGKESYRDKPNPVPGLLGQIDEGVQQLLGEMQQGRSERLERYLEFTSRFHKYSLHNQMLIFLQCPHATVVAGYRKWQDMGYQVAKGEKGIRILAPRPYQVVDEETQEVHEQVKFVSVSVFDVSQLVNTTNNPVPEFFTPLADDQQELGTRLTKAMEEDKIRVTEEETGRTQGYSGRGHVAVRAGLDSRNKVLTLLHEYAHELLHWDDEGKRQDIRIKECHAEAVSYVVAHHFGLRNPFSSDYLQHWGNTPKDLAAELDTVRRTAAYIIERIENSDEEGPSSTENFRAGPNPP